MIDRFIKGCGRFACQQYKLVLALAFLLTLLSLIPPFFLGTKTHVSVSSMMPKEIPAAKSFNRALQDFGTADEVFIIFRVADKEDTAAVEKYAIKLADALRNNPEFQDAYCQYVRPEERGFLEKELLKNGLLYLPKAGIEEVQKKLSKREIAKSAKRTLNKLSMQNDESTQANKLTKLNVLDIFPIFKKYLGGAYSHMGKKSTGTLMTAEDGNGSIILLAAQPHSPAQRLEYSARIMELVRKETNNI